MVSEFDFPPNTGDEDGVGVEEHLESGSSENHLVNLAL